MLQAAFRSRSRTELHLGQDHSRSLSLSSLFIAPQLEQVFDEGAKRPIFRIFTPYHSALYSNIVTKVDHPTSLMACAKLWLLTMLLTAKSSIAIVWFSRISLVLVLCRKSLRLLTTSSYSLARRCLVRLPLFLEYLRCTYFNLFCALRKCFGFSTSTPSDVTKNDLIPRSTPMVARSFIGALLGLSVFVSTSIEAKYLPVKVLLMVAFLIIPLISRCRTILIPSLNFGIKSLSPSTFTFCGTEKDCLPRCFDLNFGKPAPLKNFEYAVSKLSNATCKDWLFTSFNHGKSFFKPTICFCRSYLERLTRLLTYAFVFVSKARLYTKRLLPICLAINSFCELVGYIRYFRALYINTNIQFLTEITKKSKIIINFESNSTNPR